MNFVYWGIGLAGVGGVIYIYGKRKLEEYIVKRVLKELDNQIENEDMFKPMHKNSAVIKLVSGGKKHSIYVPYNSRKSTTMLRRRVYLLKGETDNPEKIDISQKPGIPYLICARDLGGFSILVENLDGEVVKTYNEDEIPSF